MRVTEVGPDKLAMFWPYCVYWITSACERTGGVENVNEQLTKLVNDRARLVMVVDRGLCIAALLVERDKDALHITSCGGCEIKTWTRAALDKLKEIAGREGKNVISLEGRKGWKRYLEPYGFEQVDAVNPGQTRLRWAL